MITRNDKKGARRRRGILLLLALLPAPDFAPLRADEGHRYLILRYDDYSPFPMYDRRERSPGIERRLFQLAAKHDAKVSVGIVPFPVDPRRESTCEPGSCSAAHSWLSNTDDEWVVLLRDYLGRGVLELALHGFEHRRTAPLDHRPGEFRAQPIGWQQQAVGDGQAAILAALGIQVDVFIPPWNAWDAQTAQALALNGFTWLSPDPHHADLPAATIRVVPQSTASPDAALRWMQDSSIRAGEIIVLVAHPFDFDDHSVNAYEAGIAAVLAEAQRSPQWKAVGFGDLPKVSIEEWDRRFRAAVSAHHARQLLHDSVGSAAFAADQSLVYRSPELSEANLRTLWFRLAVWLAIPTAAGMAAGWLGWRVLHRTRARALPLLLGACLLGFLVWGAVDVVQKGYAIRGVRWQAIFAVAGFFALSAISIVRDRRRSLAMTTSISPSWAAILQWSRA
jgi:predicted deacetylase